MTPFPSLSILLLMLIQAPEIPSVWLTYRHYMAYNSTRDVLPFCGNLVNSDEGLYRLYPIIHPPSVLISCLTDIILSIALDIIFRSFSLESQPNSTFPSRLVPDYPRYPLWTRYAVNQCNRWLISVRRSRTHCS